MDQCSPLGTCRRRAGRRPRCRSSRPASSSCRPLHLSTPAARSRSRPGLGLGRPIRALAASGPPKQLAPDASHPSAGLSFQPKRPGSGRLFWLHASPGPVCPMATCWISALHGLGRENKAATCRHIDSTSPRRPAATGPNPPLARRRPGPVWLAADCSTTPAATCSRSCSEAPHGGWCRWPAELWPANCGWRPPVGL